MDLETKSREISESLVKLKEELYQTKETIQQEMEKNLQELKDASSKGDRSENAAFTAVTLGIISTILGIILNEKSIFKIVPIYQDRNILNLQFDGIFVLNKIHIIDIIIYVLKMKRRVNKNGRSSNRRAYAYSNE